MTQWKGQYAPWISDPDPPEKPMSDEQLEKFGKGVKALLQKHSTKPKRPDWEDITQSIMKRFNVSKEEAEKMIDEAL